MIDQPLISLLQCSVKLGDHWALDTIDFQLRSGERWVLIGENGAGKSVLLKLLRGDMWPTPTGVEQRRYCFDDEINDQPAEIKRHIVLLTPERQDKYVRYEWPLKVVQVVTTGLFDEDYPLTAPGRQQQQLVMRVLKRCKLWSLRDRRFLTLSYGQRRRVLLARMLVAKPRVLLLDEVFNGLDAVNRRFLLNVLEDTRTASTWIAAVHSTADIPANATHFARLRAGRLIEAGPIESTHREHLTGAEPALTNLKIAKRNIRRDGTQPLLVLRDVTLYRDYRPVLHEFDWTVRRGENWAIVGANGSGKSSLLMLLYGDLHPALGGQIVRQGHARGTPIAQWKRRVALVSPELQADHFRAGTLEHVAVSGLHASVGLHEKITAADRKLAHHWLNFFGLRKLHDRGVREISYGQMRLALFARAMMNRPELLLLDEPFTGLDPNWRAYVADAIAHVVASGTQVIMALHQAADMIPVINKVLKIERGGKIVTADFSP